MTCEDEHLKRTRASAPGLGPGRLAQIACLLEATARKPGNVHRFADFPELEFTDFLLSATAIAGPLDRAADIGVGAAVFEAIEATRNVVSTNTNLGIVLLLAPLAAVPAGIRLADGVESVLASTAVADARHVYCAIRLAQPGGLGEVPNQDVTTEPTISLRAVMGLAAEKDAIALQYVTGFRDVFGQVQPALSARCERASRSKLRSWPLTSICWHLAPIRSSPASMVSRQRVRYPAARQA